MRLALIVMFAVTSGCQIIVGIGDPPTSHATAIEARGIIEPVEVRLVSVDIDETIPINGDGVAKFSSRVIEGESYALSLVGTVACVLGEQAGVAAGDLTVSLICQGVTRLAGLSLTTASGMQPALDPTTVDYAMAVSELQQSTIVTATAADDEATIELQGAAIASGAASAPIDLAPVTTALTIVVDHPGGDVLRSTYTVDVTRSLALVEHAYAKANPQVTDFFGQSVDIEGDTMVIGAAGEGSLANPDDPSDQGALQSGAAYVFERDAQGTWQRTAFLKAPNADANDLFGLTIAISGDRIVVGAPFEDSGSTSNTSDNTVSRAGAAYVYRREGAQWVFEAYLKSPVPKLDAFFGWDVGIDGDRIVVGAPNTTDVATGSGEAFVFARTGTTWALEGELREDAAGQGGLGDGLGESVAIANGFVAVGALRGEVDGSAGSPANSGTVRMYALVNGVWTFHQEVIAADLFASSRFGFSVALTADRLVVGAPAFGVAGQAGSVYVFANDNGTWTFEQKLVSDTPSSGDEFGAIVDTTGDTIAVGSYREDGPASGLDPIDRTDGSVDSGAVYVFHATGAAWAQRHYIKSTRPGGDDRFGWSVALSADTLVVGAVGEDSGSLTDAADNSVSSAGAVSIYR